MLLSHLIQKRVKSQRKVFRIIEGEYYPHFFFHSVLTLLVIASNNRLVQEWQGVDVA